MFIDGYVKEMSSLYNLQVNYDRLDDIFKPHFKIELMTMIFDPIYVPGLTNNIFLFMWNLRLHGGRNIWN